MFGMYRYEMKQLLTLNFDAPHGIKIVIQFSSFRISVASYYVTTNISIIYIVLLMCLLLVCYIV